MEKQYKWRLAGVAKISSDLVQIYYLMIVKYMLFEKKNTISDD
jgi:NADH:ubiquinone oxidoreductase subunit 2 (subunit N)